MGRFCGGGEWFPWFGRRGRRIRTWGKLLFVVFCDGMGLPRGGGGRREGRNGESGVRLLLQDFSRLFWVGFPWG